MNCDPPSQAAYDADSSQFMTSVQTAFSGGQPLVYTTPGEPEPVGDRHRQRLLPLAGL